MATIDHTIFTNMLQAKSPEAYAAERQQLQAGELANALNQQKADEYKAGIARQTQLRNLLAGGADANALRAGGFLSEANEWEKNAAEANLKRSQGMKAEADAQQSQLKAATEKLGMIYNAASGARDQQSYSMALQGLQAAGVDVSGIPQQFDPAYVENAKTQALTQLQRLEQMSKQQQQAETVRHNKASEAATIRGQDVSAATARRGQDISAASAAAGRAQADQHFKATQSAGGKAGAATEDERKAAGWFAQADNAWSNMQSAMGGVDPKTGQFRSEDVARPGVADAIAAVPSFGLGEVVGNTLRSPERQKFIQASSSLSEAILRAATGAGVNKDEALQKVRELTPVFGEAPETTKQKMDSIPMYLNSLKQRAGRAMSAPQPGASKVVDFGSLK